MLKEWRSSVLAATPTPLKLIRCAWRQLRQVMPSQRRQTQRKEHGSIRPPRVSKEKLTRHPCRVRRNPTTDCQVMAELCPVAPAPPREINSHCECGKYHCHPKPAPAANPARIFEDPENDVSVLVFLTLLNGFNFYKASFGFKQQLDGQAGIEPAHNGVQGPVPYLLGDCPKTLAGRPGFEPGIRLSKSRVMPLH